MWKYPDLSENYGITDGHDVTDITMSFRVTVTLTTSGWCESDVDSQQMYKSTCNQGPSSHAIAL
jgi:hypothetical protein